MFAQTFTWLYSSQGKKKVSWLHGNIQLTDLKKKERKKKASVFMKLVFHSPSYFEQSHFYK